MTENSALFGTWEGYKSENIEAVMEKAGASFLVKKVSSNANPTMTISKVDNKVIRIASKMLAFSVEQELELGGIRRFKPPQGDEQDCTAEWRDGKLLVFAGKPGADVRGPDGIVQTREVLDNGEMLLTMQAGDTVGHRWFKRK
ncbi:hypothetical protein BOX15_Mlig004271g1 [Macrostomum lignano]|uniref:Uncharacterized protein n=2 Tax=Macrostomum lignano TaxID=282301 RepID=A0A267FSJ5_9PLAT|nr:hypothetical protein BOX15_Mlig027030g2 [Macrostomum lignano]PAA66767.1 hypothetical protein BOX15_Mlig027030g1 [Macrostomum lignano]PAA76800.1 hypothetical protein BOX15_Mlig004271g1 [Macrostomum lignano]